MVTLVADHLLGDSIALPVNITSRATEIAASEGHPRCSARSSRRRRSWTRPTSPAWASPASGDGGFILPGFLPAFDAAATFVKVLDLLGRSAVRLSSVVAELPRTHIAHETLVTPWEQKGTVMRSLVEHSKDRELVLVDGVKVLHDDGWVLALPDPEEPVTHVWAEAGSDTDARRLAQEYGRRIRQMLR